MTTHASAIKFICMYQGVILSVDHYCLNPRITKRQKQNKKVKIVTSPLNSSSIESFIISVHFVNALPGIDLCPFRKDSDI